MACLGRWLVLGMLALPQAAPATEIRYDIHWGGFHAAQALLAREGGEAALSVRTIGLVQRMTDFALEAEREAALFSSRAGTSKWTSRLAVDFSGRPQVLVDEVRRLDGKDEGEPRPPVPEHLKPGTLDPLTALAEAGRLIAAGRAARLPIYDGRNRYDVRLDPTGPNRARVTILPLAGFRPKSLETWRDATFLVTIDPATQLPAKIVSESFAVGTVISAVPQAQRTGG